MSAQPLEALAAANRNRMERTQIKRELQSCERLLSDLLANPLPRCLHTMHVEALLLAPYKMPRKSVQRMLLRAQVSLGAQVGRLTDRQRMALAEEMRDWEIETGRRVA